MSLTTPELLEALDASITIPIVPYKGGEIDYAGHAKNVDYLMTNNYLDNNRRRVLSVAGTSLIPMVVTMATTQMTMGMMVSPLTATKVRKTMTLV